MARLAFASKAEVLETLRPVVTASVVPRLERYAVSAWTQGPDAILADIAGKFPGQRLAVRSSAASEDTSTSSRAGEFHSELDVPVEDPARLRQAVEAVVAAMPVPQSGGENQFFVQEFVANVKLSGVLFTRDQDTFAPYLVVNYDDSSTRTDTVTSGASNDLSTAILHRGTPPRDPALSSLVAAADELEQLFGCDRLDIEFAVTQDGVVHILQVRPLADKACSPPAGPDDAALANHLRKARKKLAKLMSAHPHLAGNTTYFGVMPDWNPAEIIGVRPRKLALSLYRELVMDRVWAHQRFNYGYRDVRSVPLMVTFLGVPFIDIRASFNSFVPHSLPDSIADKLVNHYLSQLHNRPELHDKIEFDIVFSCSFLGLSDRLHKLQEQGFSADEIQGIRHALLELTNRIIAPDTGLFDRDMEQISVLEQRYAAVAESDMGTIDKIYWLVEDCKRYGTLPFAGIARSGFVAMQLLRSFVAEGIITRFEFDGFLNSLSTVSKCMTRDIAALHRGELDKAAFLGTYGHLRPGTYDILSPRYDENFTVYFQTNEPGCADRAAIARHSDDTFALPASTMRTLDALLGKNGFQASAAEVLKFIKRAIEGREQAKFVFSRNLSRVLVLVEEMGRRFGFAKEELAYLDIRTILGLYADLDHRDLADILGTDIATNKAYFNLTSNVRLPHLILAPDDVYAFDLPAGQPNYVTMGRVEADIVLEHNFSRGLKGRIVFIQSADPGYDWIFAKGPAGLVTMYGGANSHMAIRCAELGLPAVIGAGEANFTAWAQATRLEIACPEQKVRVVR